MIGDTSNVLDYCQATLPDGKNRKFYEIKWLGATQAGEELGTAVSSVKDGTTVPFQITVVSSQANDTDAATGDVRKVAIIGPTVSSVGAYNAGEAPKDTVEVVNMNGASDVLASRWYLKFVHACAVDWGSAGGDAVGNITIESPANTTLATIAAGYNESDGGILYFAAGDRVRLDRISIELADATIAAGDGVYLTVTPSCFYNEVNDEGDMEAFYYHSIYPYSGLPQSQVLHAWDVSLLATKTSSLKFEETLVVNSQTYCIRCTVRVD